MSKKRLLHILMAASSAVLISACGGGGGGGGSTPPPSTEPTTLADFQVVFQGPGGHSQGNYGRTNALHAAARAVVTLEKTSFEFYVKDIHGGNSVNAIASDGSITVGLLSGNVTAFEAAVKTAAEDAMNAENAFRNVTTGQISNNVRVDIRIDSINRL
jgi:hypothetical protein